MKSGKLRAGQFWLLKLAGRRALWLMLGVIFCAGGCVSARRVVLIDSDGALLRAGPGMIGPVYFLNKAGEWELGGPVKVPEGWFIGPMPAKGQK